MYVVGDMDIYIKKEEDSSLLLIETLQGIGLKRWIEGTTRYSKNDSCIDLIFLNSSNIMNAGILDVDISDHQMVSLTKTTPGRKRYLRVDCIISLMKDYS